MEPKITNKDSSIFLKNRTNSFSCSYDVWKFIVLSKHRISSGLILQVVISMVWALPAIYTLHDATYWRTFGTFGSFSDAQAETDGIEHKMSLFLLSLPAVMTAVHWIILGWCCIIGPIYLWLGKQSVSDTSQGAHLISYTAFSAMVCIAYISVGFYIRYKVYETNLAYLLPNQTLSVYCCAQFVLPAIVNQSGGRFAYVALMYCLGCIWWVVFLVSKPEYTILELVLPLMANLYFLLVESCREKELSNLFAYLQGVSESKSEDGTVGSTYQLLQEIRNTFGVMEASLQELYHLMGKVGALEPDTFEETLPQPPGKRPKGHVSFTGYRWNKNAAHINEVLMLVLAVIISKRLPVHRTLDVLETKRFSLKPLCVSLFTMVETTRGRRLPLYTSTKIEEVVLSAKEGVLKIILLLLVYDSISDDLREDNHHREGVTCVHANIVGDMWRITVSTTRTIPSGSPVPQIADTALSNSSLLLASELAESYMGGKLEVGQDVDSNARLMVKHRTFRVFGSTYVGDLMYSKKIAAESDSWLIVDCHANARDLFDYQQFMFSLKMLGIPYEVCSGVKRLNNWKRCHSVVVVSDTTLDSKHMHLLLDLNRVQAKDLVVISDSHTPSHFKEHFDLNVTESVLPTPDSILSCVRSILKASETRVLLDKNLCQISPATASI